MKSLSVYIHIPFCVQKCVYCDFLSAPANAEKRSQYVAALKKEIELNAEKYADNYGVTTIFFGGGTPSLLSAEDIETILYSLKQKYNFRNGFDNTEITLEMNPGTASLEKLIILRYIGINRLSIGLQSANDDELKLLGRIHTYEQFAQT
ncbi:MAG: radical SAM protein, partial [Lachnospiraceae bacterium]|nr:radical SAM protein [Lachnospiraceae bacterium]